MDGIYDVIIIGSGPAGLAAGIFFESQNLDYLILEKGMSLPKRDANKPEDVASGVGGCGLFSDGKLSFPPSASNLWSSYPPQKLEDSYKYLFMIFNELGISIPVWDLKWTKLTNETSHDDQKEYTSILLEQQDRQAVLSYFDKKTNYRIKTNSEVLSISKRNSLYEVKTISNGIFLSERIIIATGKFGNEFAVDALNFRASDYQYKMEIGIRIKTPSEFFVPYTSDVEDYKMIKQLEDNTQFRSFCCCKDGIVIQSKFGKYFSYNGAKVQFKTGYSNIGLLIRATDPQSLYYKEINSYLKSDFKPFEVTANDFLNNEDIKIGKEIDKIIIKQLHNFITNNEDAMNQSFVYGPEIEYIGKYPNIESDFTKDGSMYIAGDVTGSFRGLLAALISGTCCAFDIAKKRNERIKKDIDILGIKISKTDPLDLVFTAQSKKMFYCKDVICEFVLKQNKLPINPFMVFGYFLNDRVDRNLVRQGNNQLITSCKELWVFGPIADGVLFEIALAKLQNKPIRFFKLGTYLNEIEEITNLNEVGFEPEVHSKQIRKEDLIQFISGHDTNFNQMSLFV